MNRLICKHLLLVSALCASLNAIASEVIIKDNRCVATSAQKIHNYITTYDRYFETPGATYSIDVPLSGKLKLLEMKKSQAKFNVQTEKQTNAFVWVVFRPMGLDSSKFYPRFLLECASQVYENGFNHACRMVKDKEHYGLDDFRSKMKVIENDPNCPPNNIKLDYALTLIGNSGQVEQIKTETLKPAGAMLAPILGKLFGEDAFFRNYFTNLYEGWMTDLSK